jgi:hypothetical protein
VTGKPYLGLKLKHKKGGYISASIPTSSAYQHVVVSRSGFDILLSVGGASVSFPNYNGAALDFVCPMLVGATASTGCNSSLTNFYNGQIDDFRIYNKGLSSAEIAELGKPASLQLYWKFNEGSGVVAQDSSLKNQTGVLTGGPTYSDDKPNTSFINIKSLNFDGSNDYVVNSSVPSDYGNLTLSFWLKTSSGMSTVIDFAQSTLLLPGLQVFVTGDGRIRLVAGGGPSTRIETPIGFTNNQWHHVVVVRSANLFLFYVDGNLIGSKAGTVLLYKRLFVGGRSTNDSFFRGLIDDVRYYRTDLSASEVSLITQGGPVVKNLAGGKFLDLKSLIGSLLGLFDF